MAAMTPETKVKTAIIKLIRETLEGTAYSLRNTPSALGIGVAGRPDMMLIIDGHIVEIEVKARSSRGKPTAAQVKWLTETYNAGGDGWVIWGDVKGELDWLRDHIRDIASGYKGNLLKLKCEAVTAKPRRI